MIGAGTYIGRPCKYGHSGHRYTSNRRCVVCDRLANQGNEEWSRLYQRARRFRLKDDPEYKRKNLERTNRWRAAHPYADITAKAQMRRDKASDRSIEQGAVRHNTMAILYYPQEADQYSVRRVTVPFSDDVDNG